MVQKHRKFIGLVLMMVVIGCMSQHKSALPADTRTFSKEAWKSEVLDSSAPVLVDFGADWCGPCHMMDPTIATLAKEYRVVKVNVDNNDLLASQYKISSIPALLIFKNGEIVERFTGVTDENSLRAALEKASSGE